MFQCSEEGCSGTTPGHYCDDHCRRCPGCGEEFTADDLNADGLCAECVAADGDDLPEIDDNDRGVGLPVTVDGVPRFF